MGPVIQIEKPRANHRLARMSTCHVAQLPIQKSEVETEQTFMPNATNPQTYTTQTNSASRAYQRALDIQAEVEKCIKAKSAVAYFTPPLFWFLTILAFVATVIIRSDIMMPVYANGAAGVLFYILDSIVFGTLAAIPTAVIVALAVVGLQSVLQRQLTSALERKFRAEDKYRRLTGRFPETFSLEERMTYLEYLS